MFILIYLDKKNKKKQARDKISRAMTGLTEARGQHRVNAAPQEEPDDAHL